MDFIEREKEIVAYKTAKEKHEKDLRNWKFSVVSFLILLAATGVGILGCVLALTGVL